MTVPPLKKYSTGEAVKRSGVPKVTLLRWMRDGRIPKADSIGLPSGSSVFIWTDDHIAAAKKLKGTIRKGPKPRAK